MSAGRRANGEGSIYPYRDGMFAAYVWVSAPDGKRRRKYVYGATRELVHTKWLELHRVAAVGPVSTTTPTLSEYMTYWLREVVAPSLKPKTAETYEMHHRLYIERGLGRKRLDRIIVRDVRTWLEQVGRAVSVLRARQGRSPAGGEPPLLCGGRML